MGTRRRGPASSLDLLLDTICNTFGGVVFIAILVSVLLQMTRIPQLDLPPAGPQHEELVELETHRHEREGRIKWLRDAASQQKALLANMAEADDQPSADQTNVLRSRRDQLHDDRMKSLGKISQSQIKTNEVATELAALEQSLREAPAKIAALEAELQRELAIRTQDTQLPFQHETDKREIPFLLSVGRLHSVYQVKPDGSVAFNSGECLMSGSSGMEEVKPKPGTGAVIQDDDASRAAVSQCLRNLENDTDYLAVFVWPDSFAQFRSLKELLVNQKYEYRLVPMATGQKVFRGAGSKSKVKVQ